MITSKRLGGYTLVEVTIVMAIAGGLGVLAFVGQAQLRSQANFNGGIQQIKTFVLGVKNQASATVTSSTSSSYTSVFYGKVLQFSDASPGVVSVSTLTTNSSGIISQTPPGNPDSSTYTMPDGITYDYSRTSPTQYHSICLVYTRTEANANPVTYLIPNCDTAAAGGLPGALTTPANYIPSNQAAFNITLTSSDGKQGTLAVDPANGTLEESFQ